MKRLPLSSLAFLLSGFTAGAAEFPFAISGHNYILVTTAATWASAQADATGRGGQLARINDAAENAAVFAKLATLGVTTTAGDGGGAIYVWLGGQETTEGSYSWADGTPFWSGGPAGATAVFSYSNWGRGSLPGGGGPEPDNFAGIQNRAAMALQPWPAGSPTSIGVAGQWNDIAATNSLAYLVELPPYDGIYATFQMEWAGGTTGEFKARLYPERTPVTVAAFVGLAEGNRPWVDAPRGRVQTAKPYFDGLTMHRVIKDFMIQGGDPAGNGTGGPGFVFWDEFNPALVFRKTGLLAMANSGLGTNGSQFFVTTSTPRGLDHKHTIFGEVISGYTETVLPISNTAVGPAANGEASRPVQTVKIKEVTISRVGAAAAAFADNTAPLAIGREVQMEPSFDAPSGKLSVAWPRRLNAIYQFLASPDLEAWTSPGSVWEHGTLGTGPLDITGLKPAAARKHFFKLAEMRYPGAFTAPDDPPFNQDLILNMSDGVSLTCTFAILINGAHGYWGVTGAQPSGYIFVDGWDNSPIGVRLGMVNQNLVWNTDGGAVATDYANLFLTFTSATGGTFYGHFTSASGGPALMPQGGTFTLTPLAP